MDNCKDNDNNWMIPFTQSAPIIPKMYWDVYSQEERIKKICERLQDCVDYCTSVGININLNHEDIVALQTEFEKFKESGFLDYYEAQIETWINTNMPNIIKLAIKTVYFGINDDGYFVAYIPDSWSDITFDTGANYETDEYGRLILLYNVNN